MVRVCNYLLKCNPLTLCVSSFTISTCKPAHQIIVLVGGCAFMQIQGGDVPVQLPHGLNEPCCCLAIVVYDSVPVFYKFFTTLILKLGCIAEMQVK